MAHHNITHCIFDMDGLLLDTESFYTVVQQKILAEYGMEFTWDLKAKMMGKKALAAAQTLIDELGLEDRLTAEDFLKQREELLDEMFPQAQLMPGVERLINHLHASKIPIAVATSSHRRHFELKTRNHKDFFSLFNHIITGDQVTNGKPSPDIFLQACRLFETAPEPATCLVFEDAPSGVEAALAAGMSCVMVPDPNLDRNLCTNATVLIESLELFLPEQWGLPAFA